MNLPDAVRKWWGFDGDTRPFGDTPDGPESLFRWPAFDGVIARMEEAVHDHRFLVVTGSYGASKSTAYELVRERLLKRANHTVVIAEPHGLDPRSYDENTIYRAIVSGVGDGQKLRQSRAARAEQCLEILQAHVARSGAGNLNRAALVINDAHECRREFLLVCKRLWDRLYGFERLISVVLIGHEGLHRAVEWIGEINLRRELVVLPGLGDHAPAYVQHECQRCGAKPADVFSDEALDAFRALGSDKQFDASDAPLHVNALAVRALCMAKAIGLRPVDRETVERALKATDADVVRPARRQSRLKLVK